MRISLQLVLIFLGVVVILAGMAWIFVPVLSGLPWVPTHLKRIRKALELSALQPNEILYDLGSGDGRVLVHAARQYGVRAVGIELSPTHCILAWARVWLSRVLNRVSIRWGNFYKMNLEEADVVFAYLTPAHAQRLRSHLESQLRQGSRVVTVSADIDGWEPSAFDSENLIFLYHVPPKPGNLTTFLTKEASSFQKKLSQQ